MARDQILHKVRTALGRSVGQAPAPAPEVYLRIPVVDRARRVSMFREKLEALAGKTAFVASRQEAAAYVAGVVAGREAVASNAPYLADCGITSLAGVKTGFKERDALRAICATAPVGITSADYAIADTGTLVMIASPSEARLVSLLPPAHVAVIPASKLLTGLDELYTLIPNPERVTSSMVLITGPSRTADIEQILVRGVHGPGEIHVVIVDE
jgi:L-lactate dehydrogenase complex protein LldG